MTNDSRKVFFLTTVLFLSGREYFEAAKRLLAQYGISDPPGLNVIKRILEDFYFTSSGELNRAEVLSHLRMTLVNQYVTGEISHEDKLLAERWLNWEDLDVISADYALAELKKQLALMKIRNICEQIIMNEKLTFGEILSKLEEALSTGDGIAQLGDVNITDVQDLLAEEIIYPGAITGIDKVDEAIVGFPKGAYSIIAGKTGLGKTYFLLHCFWESLKKNYDVYFVSGEMTSRQIIHRLFTLEYGGYKDKRMLNSKHRYVTLDLGKGEVWIEIVPKGLEEVDIQKLESSFVEQAKNFDLKARLLTVDSLNNVVTYEAVERFVKQLKKDGKKVDAVFIDAPEAITFNYNHRNVDDVILRAEFFNTLALKYNIAIIVSWQVVKNFYRKQNIIYEDVIKGRAEILQLASLAMILAQTEVEKRLNIFRLKIVKNRHSISDTATYFVFTSALPLGKYCVDVLPVTEKQVEEILKKAEEKVKMLGTGDEFVAGEIDESAVEEGTDSSSDDIMDGIEEVW